MCALTYCPRVSLALVASSGLLLAAASAPGAIILQAGGWQVEVDDTLVSDVDLYVDFVSLRDNVIVIEKFAQFRGLNDITGRPDAINLTFTQIADDAQTVSRIAIADEAVTNLTTLDWIGFEMALLDGGGAAVFNTGLSANFSINPFTTRAYSDGDTVVTFGGGTVADGTTWFPGAADGELVIDVDLSGTAPEVFTLKELPLPVPAPGAAVLIGAGLVLASRRRRSVL